MKKQIQLEGRTDVLLNIKLLSGDCEIKFNPVLEDVIELEVPDVRKNTAEELFHIDFTDGVLTIREEKNFGIKNFLSLNLGSRNIEIVMPENIKSGGSIELMSGDLDVSDFECIQDENLKLKLMSGDIEISNFKGGLNGQVLSGDVNISESEFSFLKLKAMSGDIELDDIKLNLVKDGLVDSVSGDVNANITSIEGEGKLNFKCLSGDCDISGDYDEKKVVISSAFKDIDFGGKMEFLKGLNPFVNKARKHGDVEYEEKKEKPKQGVDKILDMLAEGKISADDAEKLIKAINNK